MLLPGGITTQNRQHANAAAAKTINGRNFTRNSLQRAWSGVGIGVPTVAGADVFGSTDKVCIDKVNVTLISNQPLAQLVIQGNPRD
jgi:hypothetical protein